MYIVSACLAGQRCRYDGTAKPCPRVIGLIRAGKAIPVCPEELGGLPTPRAPAEIVRVKGGQKVLQKSGTDVTAEFVKGAREALRIARLNKAEKAILKSKSPSCGIGQIYDGTFRGQLTKGDGVTAQLLKENGIECETKP